MKFTKMVFMLFLTSALFAADGKDIAKSLSLDPSSKAVKQWEGIFSKPDKMAQMGISKLSDADKEVLKKYLMDHAADSDHPAAAGI